MVQQPHIDPPQKADDEYQDASRSTAEFIQNVAPLQEHKRKSRKRRFIVLVAALVIGLGVGGYALYSYLQRNSEKEPAEKTSQTERQAEPEPSDGQKRYSSTDLNLSLEHPADWQVHDEEQGILKLESPVAKLTDQAGQEIDAKVVLSVVPKSSDMPDFPDDQATGVRQSEKFKYDSPAEHQRQETFLSFMNLDGSSNGLNAMYITGDSSYVKGDPITKADFEKVEPIIWLEFYACPDQTCASERLTIAPDEWDSNPMLQTAFIVLKSFNIK